LINNIVHAIIYNLIYQYSNNFLRTHIFLLFQDSGKIYTAHEHPSFMQFSTNNLISIWYFNTLRTGDADLRFYITTVQDGWRRFAFLTRNSVHLQVLLSATPQGGMFPEVSHPQALLGCLVSISWKFQFTKIVSEFVINF